MNTNMLVRDYEIQSQHKVTWEKITATWIGTRTSGSYTNLNSSNTSEYKAIYVDELIKPIPKNRKVRWYNKVNFKVNASKDVPVQN